MWPWLIADLEVASVWWFCCKLLVQLVIVYRKINLFSFFIDCRAKLRQKKNQAMEHSMSENSCQLCAVEKLTFEPPPIYCTPCGARIKRNAMYYTVGAGDTRHSFCIPCYNEARGDTIAIDGTAIPKIKQDKKK